MIRKPRAVKSVIPAVKPATKGFSAGPVKSTLGNIASGKPPRQVVNPIKTDRGSFGIKS